MSLDLSPDELAGIVDLFGVLSRTELEDALEELAYRRGVDTPGNALAPALDAYAVVAVDPEETGLNVDGEELLAVGPAAFPTLPDGAADLPHILDIDSRPVDRGSLAPAIESQFRADVAHVVAMGDHEEMHRLLDVSYDLEAWGPVDLAEMRDRLDDALADSDR